MRSEFDVIRDLFHYNSGVRRKYLDAIWKLPPEQRYKNRGASFPSMTDIYTHVLEMYQWWFISVYGDGKPFEGYAEGRRFSISEAARETSKVERLVGSTLREIGPRGLNKTVSWRGPGAFKTTVRGMLLELVGEELQHRGELNALFWQMDIDPPVTGYTGEWR